MLLKQVTRFYFILITQTCLVEWGTFSFLLIALAIILKGFSYNAVNE